MKALIIGAGAAGGIHAGILRDRGHEVSVYDLNAARAEALGEQLGVGVAMGDDGPADLAVVAVPACAHRAVVERQVALGRRVVCEKPLALTALDAHALAATCDPARVFVAESQAYGGADGLDVARMRDRVRAGEFGPEVIWRVCAMTSYRPQAWCMDAAIGGGAFLEGGAHVVTVARVLFGAPVRWQGSARRFAGGTAPDSGILVIDYEAGHQLQLSIGWGTAGCFTKDCAPLANNAGLFGAARCEAWWPGDDHAAMWTHLEQCLAGAAQPVATLDDAAGAVADVWHCLRGGMFGEA